MGLKKLDDRLLPKVGALIGTKLNPSFNISAHILSLCKIGRYLLIMIFTSLNFMPYGIDKVKHELLTALSCFFFVKS